MQHKSLKYFFDIESIIIEIEAIKTKTDNNFILFKSDIIFKELSNEI